MKELYLKTKLFDGGCEFVVFDFDEDRDTEFVKDGYRYEWVDNFDKGEEFYTIHYDDAEGNFVEDPLKDYYVILDDAKTKCDQLFMSQDPTTPMGMYVMKWIVGEEYLDGSCVFEMNVKEEE